jgi:hypothetical protein
MTGVRHHGRSGLFRGTDDGGPTRPGVKGWEAPPDGREKVPP